MESLRGYKHIYFVGIKGVAMTALAIWAKDAGHTVWGSDVKERFPTEEELTNAGIRFHESFSPSHVILNNRPDIVIYTGAHGGRGNVEVREALKFGIPCIPHGQALGMAMSGKTAISVAGSHGKTTTSAMISSILLAAHQDPSYAIGCGGILGIGPPGRYGKGLMFVAEADEYVTDPTCDKTARFLWQTPGILVVTNIDFDHPDAYSSIKDVQSAFIALQKRQQDPNITIVNADDESSTILQKNTHANVLTFGRSKEASYRLLSLETGEDRSIMTIRCENDSIHKFALHVPGWHNGLNALASIVACRSIHIDWNYIEQGLDLFYGTKRRFEVIGTYKNIRIIDDYAHHPSEIAATLAAARLWYPKRRIIAVFQPHTYSRTKVLFNEFSRAFSDSDIVILTNIYASAREQDTLGIDTNMLVNETAKHHKEVHYAPEFNDVIKLLKSVIKRDDVLLFMGAGDIYHWSRKALEIFEKGDV